MAVENFIIYETLAPGRIFEQAAGQTIPPPLKDNMQNTAKCIDGARGALELDPACHRQSPLKGDYNHPDKTIRTTFTEVLVLRPRAKCFDWTTCKSLEIMYTVSANEHMLENITFIDSNWLTNRSCPSVTRCSSNKTTIWN